MSNVFQEVVSDPKGVEERLLGPTYPYQDNIRIPSEIGMSDEGTLKQMGNNVNGLIEYVKLLVSGDSKASVPGGPLGNKFFLQTGAKCLAKDSCTDDKDTSTCQQVDRYIYINNVPQGNLPFIPSAMGVDFKDFRGLIPGALTDANRINPFGLLRAFLSGSTPMCQEVTLDTVSNDNVRSSESHYLTTADIMSMDPCLFPDNKNPITNIPCRETFKSSIVDGASPVLPEDPVAQIYYASLACVGIYILYRIMEKSR